MKFGYASAATCALAVLGSMGAERQAIEGVERYCAASWRQAGIQRQDWDDCTQQVFAEMIDRVSCDGLVTAIEGIGSSERRELNRAIWRTTQRWRRRSPQISLFGSEAIDERTGRRQEIAGARESIEESLHALSERQQAILRDALDGFTVQETAARLGSTPERVSDQKYKALRHLRQVLIPHHSETPRPSA